MLYYVILYYVMLCYYVILYYVMLCYAVVMNKTMNECMSGPKML